MASITFTIGALTKTYTISSSHMTRIIDALRVAYGPVSDGQGDSRPMTNPEVFEEWHRRVMNNLKSEVLRIEGDEAARIARETILPIETT